MPSRTIIPPQSGRSFRISQGDLIRVIDPRGQRVADLWAFATDDKLDWLSTSHTRDIGERLFPAVGESFYSTSGAPILTLVADDSPGPHDMLYPTCNNASTSAPASTAIPTATTICTRRWRSKASPFPSRRIRSTCSRIRCRNRMAGWMSMHRSIRRVALSRCVRSAICFWWLSPAPSTIT